MRNSPNIDLKDKRILREIFSNGRMPYSEIGKKVRLSKEVVRYRIEKLKEKGLLLGFNTVYNVRKIKWHIFLVYIKLKDINNEKENEIIKYLIDHPNIAWCVKCIGNYDFVLKIFVKDRIHLGNILKEMEQKYNNFDEFIVDNTIKEMPIPNAYLYEPLKPDRIIDIDNKTIDVDYLDIEIMKLISINSRIQLSEMSQILNTPRDTIKYRLKKLEKEKVIITYRPSAWSGTKSLGFSWYLVLLKFKQLDSKSRSTLMEFLTTHTNLAYVYELLGEHDLGFEIRLKTGDQLNEILMEIRAILGSDFKRNELSLILKEYKYTYFPECVKEII
ncbi:Lrp/AsnC family transcriptional regulator [archaeon]|nr:Lrp/AsnC family transcriptional regulator [archaeon]